MDVDDPVIVIGGAIVLIAAYEGYRKWRGQRPRVIPRCRATGSRYQCDGEAKARRELLDRHGARVGVYPVCDRHNSDSITAPGNYLYVAMPGEPEAAEWKVE